MARRRGLRGVGEWGTCGGAGWGGGYVWGVYICAGGLRGEWGLRYNWRAGLRVVKRVTWGYVRGGGTCVCVGGGVRGGCVSGGGYVTGGG